MITLMKNNFVSIFEDLNSIQSKWPNIILTNRVNRHLYGNKYLYDTTQLCIVTEIIRKQTFLR